jgi:hypothetical protein
LAAFTQLIYNIYMSNLWDYDLKTLKKSEKGRILILERQINFGPGIGIKIKLSEVKKYWEDLHLFKLQKRLFELLIWGKYNSSQKNNKSFWMK